MATFLVLAGCQTTGPAGEIDPLRVPARDDVVSIQIYWPNVIWLYDSDQNPVGFQAPVYFVSGQTQRGVFVEGPIHVWLSEVSRGAGPQSERKLLHEWTLEGQAEKNFRVRRKVITGYYYGLRLKWPANLPLEGKQVELAVGYERRDGTLVKSLPRRDEVVRANKRRMLFPSAPVETETVLLPEVPPTSGGSVTHADRKTGAEAPDLSDDASAAPPQSGGGFKMGRFHPVTSGSEAGEQEDRVAKRPRPRPRTPPAGQTVDEQGRPTVIVRTRLR